MGVLFNGGLFFLPLEGVRDGFLQAGGTGIAGFVLKSGKVGCVSHVYNRYSISLRISIKMFENWGAGSTRKRAQKTGIFSGKQVQVVHITNPHRSHAV